MCQFSVNKLLIFNKSTGPTIVQMASGPSSMDPGMDGITIWDAAIRTYTHTPKRESFIYNIDYKNNSCVWKHILVESKASYRSLSLFHRCHAQCSRVPREWLPQIKRFSSEGPSVGLNSLCSLPVSNILTSKFLYSVIISYDWIF